MQFVYQRSQSTEKKVQCGFDSASVRPHAKNFNKIVLNSNKAFFMSRGSVVF